jgi:hypothetical protein
VEVMRFEVTVSSHDLLREGETEPARLWIVTASDSYNDAQLEAAQFAHELLTHYRSTYDMVTGVYPYV